jgi:hypothetical protein
MQFRYVCNGCHNVLITKTRARSRQPRGAFDQPLRCQDLWMTLIKLNARTSLSHDQMQDHC